MSGIDAEQYLSTTFRPLLSVHSSQALFGEALRIGARFRLPWYDSLIVASAIEGQCGVLYSEDLQDGEQIGGVTIALLQESANNNIVDASQPRGTATTI